MAVKSVHILIYILAKTCERVNESEMNITVTLGERRAVLKEITESLSRRSPDFPDEERMTLAANVAGLINRWGASDFILEQLTHVRDALDRMPATPT